MADQNGTAEFSGAVETVAELEEIIGLPPQPVLDKVVSALDEVCRDFIAAAPFCLIATTGADGHIDISPKGDPAGFASVINDTLIAIPDRPGNRRVDTFHNILETGRVGVMFIIPGKGETLRVRGRGRLVRDEALREHFAINGKAPKLVLLIDVDEVFFHCPKCMVRSGLWKPGTWGDSGAALPDIGGTMVRHAKLKQSPEELEAWAAKEGFLELY